MISTKYEQFWTEQRGYAALGLAEGKSQAEVAALAGVTDRTIRNWLDDDRFTAEIDRLSLMVGVASRAERLRLVNRLVKQRVREEDGYIITEKDLLDWLKFAQSETDGAKIDLSKLAEMLAGESAQQADGPATRQLAGTIDVEATQSAVEAGLDTVMFTDGTSTGGSESGNSSSLSQDVVAGPDEELNPS